MHTDPPRQPARRHITTAALLLSAGGLALAGQLAGHPLHGLWALALLVPAVLARVQAAHLAWSAHQLTPLSVRLGLGGLTLGLLGLAVVLGLPWPLVGPLLLMLLGAVALTGVRRRDLR